LESSAELVVHKRLGPATIRLLVLAYHHGAQATPHLDGALWSEPVTQLISSCGSVSRFRQRATRAERQRLPVRCRGRTTVRRFAGVGVGSFRALDCSDGSAGAAPAGGLAGRGCYLMTWNLRCVANSDSRTSVRSSSIGSVRLSNSLVPAPRTIGATCR